MCIRDRVNAEKVRIVQDADAIYREEVDKAVAAYKKENDEAPSWMPNQYFAALTNMRSVGVMGDERTYDYAVALRAVNKMCIRDRYVEAQPHMELCIG